MAGSSFVLPGREAHKGKGLASGMFQRLQLPTLAYRSYFAEATLGTPQYHQSGHKLTSTGLHQAVAN
jgi:hypothetical protein